MNFTVFKKIIIALLVVVIVAPASFLAQPKKAEAACGFGGGGGGGGEAGGAPGTDAGGGATFEGESGLTDTGAWLPTPPRFTLQLLNEETLLVVNGASDIFKSAGAGVATFPKTNFDASALENSALLAVGDASSALQSVQIGIETVVKAVSCISSIANSITSASTNALVVKEYVLDSIAYALINQVISDMLNDIQRWAITGFKGNPVFLTNPGRYFQNLADDVLGTFLNQLAGVNLCNLRWKPLIEISLSIDLNYKQRAECSFSDIGANFDRFINDFSEGGWDAWLKLTTETQNNPYGAYLLAAEELAKQTGTLPVGLLDVETLKLQWGKGIISGTKCTYGEISQGDVDSGFINENLPALDQSTLGLCKDARGNPDPTAITITTPGNIIEESINNTLGAPTNRLVMADEINETIAALLYGLMVKTFSSDDGFGGADWSNISSQVNDGSNSVSFSRVKSELLANVDSFTTSEKEFKVQKQRAFDILKESEKALNEVAACYIDQLTLYEQYLDPINTRLRSINTDDNPFLTFVKSDAENKIQTTLGILAQKITPRINPIQNSITQANVFIFEIGETREAILTADTFNKLDAKTKTFFETRERWDDPLEAAVAENDSDELKKEIDPITAQAKADLVSCQKTRQQMRDFFKKNNIEPAA